MIGLVGVVVVVGAAVFLGSRSRGGSTPATQPTGVPSVPFNTTPPIGAQVVGLDGTPLLQVPNLPADAYGLRISPDGLTIAFHIGGVEGGNIETIGIDGTGRHVVAVGNSNHGDSMTAVTWSPDGTRLAYSISGNIFASDADGSNRVQLTTSTPGTGNYYPAWSPDGRTIAYWHGSSTGQDGGPSDAEIYTMSSSGGSPTRLTHDDQSEIEPTWSPDSSQIAFFREGAFVVMDADGTRHHVVNTGKDDNHWAPAWSPDGTQVAYLSYYSSDLYGPLLEVKVVDLGTNTVNDLGVDVVTDLNGPSWMPSGDALLVNRNH